MSADDYRSRIIAARERLNLSKREMAAKLLTPWQTYQQWEDGSRRTPGIAVVAAEFLARTGRRARKPRRLSPASQRNAKIIAAVNDGKTYEAVGDAFGVSRQRIEQIVRRYEGRQQSP